MVSSPETIESRAGSLALIGGALALDFSNTASGRGGPKPQDHLRSAADVVSWARHARIVGPADAAWLNERIANDKPLAERLLARALDLREAIHAITGEIAAEGMAPEPQTERLTKEHVTCVARARLLPDRGRYVWSWTPRDAAIEAILGPIVLSMLATLTSADLTRVKQCQGENCGWQFLDTTKNKSRRWCEMEVCGNRAKQKRLGMRTRRGD